MLAETQNINSFKWSDLRIADLAKKKLTIEFDKSEVTIHINNTYKPPISWFLTDPSGEMILMGQIAESAFRIDLKEIPKGSYALRIAGEVHLIHSA